MDLIRNNKGGIKLCLDGHIYTKKKSSAHVIRWKCAKESTFSCKGGLTTDIEVKTISNVRAHSHPSDPDATAVLKLRTRIKEAARLGNAQPSEILSEVLQGASESVLSRLGDLENIRRDIRRQKAKGEEKEIWSGADESWCILEKDSHQFLHQENNYLLGPDIDPLDVAAASPKNVEVKHERLTPVQGCSDSEDSAIREPLIVIKSEEGQVTHDAQAFGCEVESNENNVVPAKKKRKYIAESSHESEDLKVECLRLERKKLSLEIERLQSENHLRKEKLQLEIEKLKEEKEKIAAEKELVRLSVLKVMKELNTRYKSSNDLNGLTKVNEFEHSLNSIIVSELEKVQGMNVGSENFGELNKGHESSEALSTEASGNAVCQ